MHLTQPEMTTTPMMLDMMGEGRADSLSDAIRRHVVQVLSKHAGNRQRTARALGVSRATLYKWLKDWNLESFGR
jgi:transcriptional regulator of acetoin/glycerol metabolism